ncbi:putative MJ1172 family protein [Synechococcus sp. A15-44]|nr:putative MJ1172 family protein [Synechococcus sp. A15-44]
MPKVRVNLSRRTIDLLEKIKQHYNLSSRSDALEMIIEQLLEDPDGTNPGQEE